MSSSSSSWPPNNNNNHFSHHHPPVMSRHGDSSNNPVVPVAAVAAAAVDTTFHIRPNSPHEKLNNSKDNPNKQTSVLPQNVEVIDLVSNDDDNDGDDDITTGLLSLPKNVATETFIPSSSATTTISNEESSSSLSSSSSSVTAFPFSSSETLRKQKRKSHIKRNDSPSSSCTTTTSASTSTTTTNSNVARVQQVDPICLDGTGDDNNDPKGDNSTNTSADDRYRQVLGPLRMDFCESLNHHSFSKYNPNQNISQRMPFWFGALAPTSSASTSFSWPPSSSSSASSFSWPPSSSSSLSSSSSSWGPPPSSFPNHTTIGNNNNTHTTGKKYRRQDLYKELLEYKLNLPVQASSSIFVRAMESRMDLLRVLITGPQGTPYGYGCFFFDVYLHDYPNQPPKVQFLTTGGGKIRFNPNLYADGKVCLSLLGTWSGPGWIPNQSTLLQVLISIQALVLGVEEPFYNEPGYSKEEISRPLPPLPPPPPPPAHIVPLLPGQQPQPHIVPPSLPDWGFSGPSGWGGEDDLAIPQWFGAGTASSASLSASSWAWGTSMTTRRRYHDGYKQESLQYTLRQRKNTLQYAMLEYLPKSTISTFTSTSTSTLSFVYPEFQTIVEQHFLHQQQAIETQLATWIQEDPSIITLANQVKVVLQSLQEEHGNRKCPATATTAAVVDVDVVDVEVEVDVAQDNGNRSKKRRSAVTFAVPTMAGIADTTSSSSSTTTAKKARPKEESNPVICILDG